MHALVIACSRAVSACVEGDRCLSVCVNVLSNQVDFVVLRCMKCDGCILFVKVVSLQTFP